MAQTNIIASNDLWSRIKAKFRFPHQSASEIIFENRCLLFQDISDFMSTPVIEDLSFGSSPALYFFAEVPGDERWKVRSVSFESASGQIDSIRISNGKDISPSVFSIDTFSAAGDRLLMFENPIVMDSGWKLGANVVTAGPFFVFLYYEKEVIR